MNKKYFSSKIILSLIKTNRKNFLLIFITISLASGVSGPLMTQLFGGTIHDASSSQDINPALVSEIELDNFFDAFQKNIDKKPKN